MTAAETNRRRSVQQSLPFAVFPATKFMGSKQSILPFIMSHIEGLRFRSVLDAFSGSGCVAYALKRLGVRVHTNDFLRFAYHTARATIENNSTRLAEEDVRELLRPNKNANTFVQDTFGTLYFSNEDNSFLDNVRANIEGIGSPLKRSLALAAVSRAAMKKRPRGIFTFTGKKGWDARTDLKLTMKEQFLRAVSQFNNAVWSNGKENIAMCGDVFDVDPEGYDLIYIDTPYVGPYSDCDYTRRYHFVEGYCRYWQGCEIMDQTRTKKIRSYETAFSSKATVHCAFQRLFDHFRKSKLVVSYSSNSIPVKHDMIGLLREQKRSVSVYEMPYRYNHGNHGHKVGDNNNSVVEYLFIAQ